MTQKPFVKSDVAYTLDALGRRYGVRPSQILQYHPLDGRGLLLDINIMKSALQREAEARTVEGKHQQNKATWDMEAYKEFAGRMI